MATEQKTAKTRKKTARTRKGRGGITPVRFLRRWIWRALWAVIILVLIWMAAYRVISPPTTFYILSEERRLGRSVDQIWVPADQIAPVMLRAVVAAEDANYCTHWGFDMDALRDAIADGGQRGASTLSQQVVKNAFLWHGRSYVRKALEAVMTPALEAMWPKRRILEVYLNIAEFDTGVFGVESAARHYFGTSAAKLTPVQAARLAAVLPAPQSRSASQPSQFVRKRASAIIDGAATIDRDGRADCFQG